MEIEIISLFPEYFSGPLDVSILKRAQEKGLVTLRHKDLRPFGVGRHKKVDDHPYGGGAGMVLKPEPLTAAIASARKKESYVIYLTPQGEVLTQAHCRRLSTHSHLILVAGHYEGIDERVIQNEVDEEISIGEYVLTSGALPALVLIDSIVRLIPGVLGNEQSAEQDSFTEPGLVDFPHYTRPEIFEGKRVPEVLLTGNHEEIAKYRRNAALDKSRKRRQSKS